MKGENYVNAILMLKFSKKMNVNKNKMSIFIPALPLFGANFQHLHLVLNCGRLRGT